jgi:hypothetical protein
MNRDYYEYARLATPNQVPQYADFMSDSNIRIISEDVAKLIKESFPNEPLFKVNERSIRDTMWSVYSTDLQHNQVMIQMVINLLAQQVILQKEAQDTSHLDPHIQDTPELFGLSYYDPGIIQLNHKRNEPLQFNGPW